jgi:glycosyltransferase involved in cell wall biosynthesis
MSIIRHKPSNKFRYWGVPSVKLNKMNRPGGSPANVQLFAVAGSEPALKLRVAVVIPAFNEEKNIESVLASLAQLGHERRDWSILPVVVNDGSTDRTAEVLRQLAPRYGAEFLNLPINLGIGRAVQAGFRYAIEREAQVVLQLDGDGQHPASQIPLIVDPLVSGHADVVVGSRYVAGAGGNVSSWMRELGTRFFSLLIRVLVGARIADTTSGFRAYGLEAALFVCRHYPDDYPEVEVLIPLARKKFRLREVPVQMRERKAGRSSITPVRSLYYMLKVAFATVIDTLRPLPDAARPRPLEARGRRGD